MVMDKKIFDVLAAHPFFREMPVAELHAIAECAREEVFEDGAMLMRQGEQAEHFFIIQHGMVTLELHVPGREPLVVETLGKDEVTGWSWLIPPYEAQFDARTVEMVRALSIEGACLREKMARDPMLGYALCQRILPVIADRLYAARVQLMDIYGHPLDYAEAPKAKDKNKGKKGKR
ncbi:MAG TPA: cyclic nucleotide-binding domain-containing protein [Chromatiales bacterium]|nr:cyclic nucleotide-binding domain-containing protein [Chromatiales bacterium]